MGQAGWIVAVSTGGVGWGANTERWFLDLSMQNRASVIL